MWSLGALTLVGGTLAVAAVEVPEKFKTERYRSVTPDRIPGGTVVDQDSVQLLRDNEAATLIDVMSATRFATPGLEGEWIVAKPHYSIPNSIWLPNVGTGTLQPAMATYFERELARVSKGNQEHPLVFFCEADCWLGWNAARRAILLGYQRVYWFPTGITEWPDLVEAVPIPIGEEAMSQ